MIPVLIEIIRFALLLIYFNFETPQFVFMQLFKKKDNDKEFALLGRLYQTI
jgi:hypothetical protein